MQAGAAISDISPTDPQFLFGYPHVERTSTGVHDPLLSSALYLANAEGELLFVANDIIFVSRETTERARRRICDATRIAPGNIMVTATHTHSGPITVEHASNEDDPTVPEADSDYLQLLEDGIVSAAVQAHAAAEPAEAGLAVADGTGVGTNRRDPAGPSDPEVPVLMVRGAGGGELIACMLVYSMHPTVLHEDSALVSADFPGMARQYLQQHILGSNCPVVYHTGPAGNQSPRHVTRANTFAEATRLGEMLGQAVARAVPGIEYAGSLSLQSARMFIDLPRREFPSVAEAEAKLAQARVTLASLRQQGAPRQQVRTAEVDWFGAEETLTLAQAAREGHLEAFYRASLPAEVQVLKVGPWAFAGLPGELFVEYGLAIKQCAPNTFVISLANGELQGYIVTEEAVREGGYEASNALFGPESGELLVQTACGLLARL